MDKELRQRKLGLYTALQITGIFFLCLIGGCFDWMNFAFSFEKITTWPYWQGVIQQMLMYSIALALGYLTTLEKEELSNKEYGEKLTLYRELLKHKIQSFSVYIDEWLNPSIKKEAIKEKFLKKLYRLDKHAKDEYKLCYRKCRGMSDEEFRTFRPMVPRKIVNFFGKALHPDKFEEREKFSIFAKWYCYRRRKYEKFASEEYINENWEYTAVKYERVNPNVFTWSVRMGDSKQSQYKVENKSSVDIITRMARKMLTVILSSLVIGSIVYDASVSELIAQANGWIAILIKYIVRVVMIFVNYFMGIRDGKNSFYNNFTWVLINRIRILKDYINWKKNNDKEGESLADKYIKAYEDRLDQEKRLEELIKQAEQKASKV
jgi:hypothetical protein